MPAWTLAGMSKSPCSAKRPRYLSNACDQIGVLPATLCNAGGVTVSYFEWKQNRQAETWDLEVVDTQLKKLMVGAARRVLATAKKLNVDMRIAAHCTALEHLGAVYNIRGIFP